MEESKQPTSSFNYEDLIWQKPGSLSPEFCALLIEKFEEDDRTYPGVTVGGLLPDAKRTLDLQISAVTGWEEEDRQLFRILGQALTEYAEYCRSLHRSLVYEFPNTDTTDAGYKIQKYSNDPEAPGH